MADRRTRTLLSGDLLDTDEAAAWQPHASRRSMLPPLRQPASRLSILQEESRWRRPDGLVSGNRPTARLIAARWSGANLSEQVSEITHDYHMLSVSLQPTKFSLWLGTRSIPNKEVIPGTIQLTRPALPARIVYYSAYDVLHLYLQEVLLRECFEWLYGKPATSDIILRDPSFSHDPLIERLGLALLSAGKNDETGGAVYADTLSLTIVVHLLGLYAEKPASTPRRRVEALPGWRLRRVVDFIEAHADRPITLAELAKPPGSVACISRHSSARRPDFDRMAIFCRAVSRRQRSCCRHPACRLSKWR